MVSATGGGWLARAAEAVAGDPVARPLPQGVSSRLEPPGAPWGGAGAELRQCAKGGSFGRAGARQEGVTQLLSARARRELGLDLERGQRRSVRARQPQLSGDEVRDEV